MGECLFPTIAASRILAATGLTVTGPFYKLCEFPEVWSFTSLACHPWVEQEKNLDEDSEKHVSTDCSASTEMNYSSPAE